ncbi:MAG: 50S ribosomal protein L33 [Candidatus Cloacimonetes bacterium]|nr:50S ribosomal protein L33 [Candidatus Cloacimonadota bacterium]
MRDIIILECQECKNRNYTTTKNKKKHTDRLQTNKYCSNCRKHTVHKQTR